MMNFGFLPQNVKTQAVAVAFSIAWLEAGVEPQPEDARARERLMGFRRELYRCFTARADVLFELAEAVLCAGGPVKTLAGLSLAPEHRRGHGALYDAVNSGRVEIARLRRSLAGLPLPRAADGRLMLAVDVSNWLRPGAVTSPGRLFCHVYGRGKGQAQMTPGAWPAGSLTCPCRYWAGCALTGCCTSRRRRDGATASRAARPGTARNSSSPTKRPGPPRTSPR